MSAIGTALWAIIQNLPQIIDLLTKLGEAIASGAHTVSVNIELKKFDKAAELAKDKKDTSGLENIFNPPTKP